MGGVIAFDVSLKILLIHHKAEKTCNFEAVL